MEQGYSTTALAGHLKVSRQTIYNWMEEYPEFFDAVKEGMAASAIWWENCLRNNASKGEGNATAAIFGLKNRAADDWRDKREFNHESEGGTMTPKALDLSKLPADALEAIVRASDGQPND